MIDIFSGTQKKYLNRLNESPKKNPPHGPRFLRWHSVASLRSAAVDSVDSSHPPAVLGCWRGCRRSVRSYGDTSMKGTPSKWVGSKSPNRFGIRSLISCRSSMDFPNESSIFMYILDIEILWTGKNGSPETMANKSSELSWTGSVLPWNDNLSTNQMGTYVHMCIYIYILCIYIYICTVLYCTALHCTVM